MTSLKGITLGMAAVGMALTSFAAGAAENSRVTFTKDILPILQQSCIACHREGGNNIAGMIAPMSLRTYKEVRPWSKAILKAVKSGKMPPWDATAEFNGIFSNERIISAEEIALIEKWVRTGAAQGNPTDAPPPLGLPENNGWNIGEPDLVVRMAEPYWVADEVEDKQLRFTVEITEEQLPENRWLRAIEWKADSPVVHHIVGGSTAPGEVEFPDGSNRQSLGSIAPGEDPTIYPEGYGKILHKGSTIRFGMHYHKEAGPGTGVWDQSMIGFRFWDPEKDPAVTHQVHWNGIGARGYEIPPGAKNWQVGAARTFRVATTLLSLHPHMHLRGQDMKYVAFFPDGTQETLLDVPAYDYDWQTNYIFAQPKLMPAGTRVELFGHYDNSAENERNPDASIPVRGGALTTDEMFIGFISYTNTEPLTAEEIEAHLHPASTGTD